MVDPRCHGRQLHLLPWCFLQIGLPLHPRRTLLQPTDTGEMRLRVVTALCDRHMGVSQRLLSSGSADVLCMEVEYENASQSEAHGDLWCRTVVCLPIPPIKQRFLRRTCSRFQRLCRKHYSIRLYCRAYQQRRRHVELLATELVGVCLLLNGFIVPSYTVDLDTDALHHQASWKSSSASSAPASPPSPLSSTATYQAYIHTCSA